MAKYLLTTFDNAEDVLLEECQALGYNAKVVASGRVVVDGEIDLLRFQTVIWAFEIIEQFVFVSLAEIISRDVIGKFKGVKCFREGSHGFSSQNVRDAFVKTFGVDKSASSVLGIDIKDSLCTIGVLVSEKKFATRNYMVRIHRTAIPPVIASIALRMSSFSKGVLLVDPMCRDGSTLIEASRMGFSAYGLDSENEVRNARINSQVAKLDIKFDVGLIESIPVNCQVITRPFEFFAKMKEGRVEEKLLKLLSICKKNDVKFLTLVMTNPGSAKDCFSKGNFGITKEKIINSGDLNWHIFVLASLE